MTEDVNISPDYFNHPKTRRLVGILGPGAEIYPIKLWCWCAKYHADSGLLAGYSDGELESVVGWTGEGGALAAALCKVNFAEKNELGFYVHDFAERNRHIAVFKERAKKAADARWAKERAERAERDALSSATSSPQAMLEQSPTYLPNLPTEPDKILVVDAPRRDHVDNSKALEDLEFVLRLDDKEFPLWVQTVQRAILDENADRHRNPFAWSPTAGILERDLRGLIYRLKDDVKRGILYNAYNVLGEKLNWPNYVLLAIQYTMKVSRKTRIQSPYGFVVSVLKKPGEIISAKADGMLSGATPSHGGER